MAIATSIVLPDAQATPVNHTFIPLGKDANNVVWWEDQSASSALGYNKLSAELKKPLPGGPKTQSTSDRVARVKLAIHTPKLETLGTADNGLTPPPTLSYIERAGAEFILPERGLKQGRKDLRKYMIGLLNDPQVIAMIEDLVPSNG